MNQVLLREASGEMLSKNLWKKPLYVKASQTENKEKSVYECCEGVKYCDMADGHIMHGHYKYQSDSPAKSAQMYPYNFYNNNHEDANDQISYFYPKSNDHHSFLKFRNTNSFDTNRDHSIQQSNRHKNVTPINSQDISQYFNAPKKEEKMKFKYQQSQYNPYSSHDSIYCTTQQYNHGEHQFSKFPSMYEDQMGPRPEHIREPLSYEALWSYCLAISLHHMQQSQLQMFPLCHVQSPNTVFPNNVPITTDQNEPLDLSNKTKVPAKLLSKGDVLNSDKLSLKTQKVVEHRSKSYRDGHMEIVRFLQLRYSKDLISRKIIEYNWNKKKKVQRRRFKNRRRSKKYHHKGQSQKDANSVNKNQPCSRLTQSNDTKTDDRPQTKSGNSSSILNISCTSSTTKKINVSLSALEIKDDVKILLRREGVFYPSRVSIIVPGNIYSVVVDGERRNKPQIFALEQLINEAVVSLSPKSLTDLIIGTRVCAFWSSKMRGLHPGIVVGKSERDGYVLIQHDDGDSRDVLIDQIRYLPEDYPFYEDNVSLGGGFPSLQMMRERK